ncbi:hydrolase TatD [Pedobacter yulinensis]|uniref:Hydrolase TatD n=1 Tax=Pedobacter yulinensis TaxID=2126353 RepID=A0A2T3HP51_9SPHI|nr:TatD family hydrolase [Pedobacter yulinensis]PST84209.1 hydrolase TatD [Pedobacter yulinensis]
MVLTDTHTHIYYEKDPEQRAEQVQRCLDAGISRLFLPNVDVESVAMIDEMTATWPEYCFAMTGLHPCDVKDDYQRQLAQLHAGIAGRQICAIGEIGIDLHWDKSTLTIQQDAFRQQIAWAKSLQLPIVIHCREAFDEVFEVLESERDERLRGIFHCFTGNAIQAEQAIGLNFYLGIGGVVTYKNSGLDAVVALQNLEHLVLETDAPYLAPVPHRGKRNESSYLVHIARRVAEIKGVSLEEVARITTANSQQVFGI